MFDLLLKAFQLKRRNIAIQGLTSKPDFSYPNLSLPYHYATTPTRQNSKKFKYIH